MGCFTVVDQNLLDVDLIGVKAGRILGQLKLGFGDSPDFKALAGWSFKAN